MIDIKKILLYILIITTLIISYYLATNIYNIKYSEENNNKIVILNGIKLKEKAKCFKLHEINSEKLNNVLQKMNKSEIEIRTKYNNIIKNHKLSTKQKQKEISNLENNWKQISENYNKEIQNIKSTDEKLTKYIHSKLNEILEKFAKKMNINAILNKENSDAIFVFYNKVNIDITDKIIDELDNTLKDLDIKDFSNIN